MRPTRDGWAMEVAKVTSKRATCLRRQVGCVMLNKRGHVLSTGFNGVASGMPHCNHEALAPLQTPTVYHPYACKGATSASGTDLDSCQAIHAEQNALLQCRDIYSIHTCYATCSPCVTCTKLLLNTSCTEIIFAEAYAHDAEARRLWENAGRVWRLLT